ncbi:MAG: homoserine O-acetyltransferase [Pseudomonadales bacterium]|nr:homoserine O-acetyltransferase [Pseudomonadales bacterium]
MRDKFADSVGLVSEQFLTVDQPLLLSSGHTLANYTLAYECYGQLNDDASNAVLICHALSSSHHAAGFYHADDKSPGWWDNYIGPNKAIDTNQFFVVCVNNLGSCYGSTGPTSINPETGQAYGPEFPMLRVRDWVESQMQLMQHLKISKWAAIVGGSLGGMQVMRWATEYPDLMHHCLIFASAMQLTAQNIAFNETARQAISSDPDFHQGHYQRHATIPAKGLALARMIGHLTYLSDDAMDLKFGRNLRSGSFQLGQDSELEFQVESYLRYQGDKFSKSFDANSYILMTRVLDFFDLAREYDNDPVKAFEQAKAKFLVVSFSTDWRFSPARSIEITNALIAANKQVVYAAIDSDAGHDAFLLKDARFNQVFSNYMHSVADQLAIDAVQQEGTCA